VLPDRLNSRFIYPIIENTLINKYCKEIPNELLENAVLFIPTELNHLDQMLPVTNAMKNKGSKFIYLTNKINVLQKYNKFSDDPIYFIDTRKNKFTTEKKDFVGNLSTSILELQNTLNIKFEKRNADRIITFLKENTNIFIETVLYFDKISKIEKVKGVVVGNDLSVEGRIAVNMFRKNKVKSFCLMHGRVGNDEPLHQKHIADLFIVFGSASYEDLIKIGSKPENLFVGGAPYLDKIFFELGEKNINKFIQKKLRINESDPKILVTLSGPGHCTTFKHFYRIVDSIFDFASKNLKYQFIFKLHPKDSLQNYITFIDKYKIDNVKVIEHYAKGFPKSIFDWICGIDALITGSSSVAVEAMLLDKPVITIDYFQEYLNVDFIEEGCTVRVSNENELTNVLLNIKGGNPKINSAKANGKIFVNKYFTNIGASSEIISNKMFKECLI
jgi:hypothetical protein